MDLHREPLHILECEHFVNVDHPASAISDYLDWSRKVYHTQKHQSVRDTYHSEDCKAESSHLLLEK